MDADVSADHISAGGITGAELDREEVVGAGEAVIGYIDSEADLFISGSTGSGDVGLVTVENEGGDLAGAERHSGSGVIINQVTRDH